MYKKTKFVIQDHTAKRSGHHWDLRIQKGNTLKSWAIPKHKIPTEKGERLKAIQTKDHPLWWGDWEGTIKYGYGKGKVKIYDRGDCIIYNWTPLSIRFDLKGEHVKGKFSLIHIGHGKDWLLIRSNK